MPVHHLGDAVLRDPDPLLAAVERLRAARLTRTRHVVLLDPSLPWSRLLVPERERRPLWVLGPDHRLLHDELAHHLAAMVDARGGTPVWWPGVRALALGATPLGAGSPRGTRTQAATGVDGADPDVRLPDGRPAHIDAGPRAPIPGWPEASARVHVESVRLVHDLTVERDVPPTEQLSAEQRAAVTHGVGPARVLAPAGSGKTRVLAARLRHLVHDRGVQPGLITALAYNTRAAQELVERTRDVVADGVRPHVRTVHALGLAVCTAALGRRPVVLDARATAAALREASAGVARVGAAGGPSVDKVLTALTDVRLGLRDPAEVEASRGDVPGFAALVPRYRALLHARGWLDFDEQVHLAIVLLLADPSLRARVQRTTTHLIVDEAQDLTPAFVLLMRLLVGPAQQLFAVGDDDQTIYGYAGATPRVLVDLPDGYLGTTTYPLTVNHRCPPDVVRAASALLAHNTVRVAKDVRPGVRARPCDAVTQQLEVLEAPAGTATRVLMGRIGALLGDHDPDDVAVLARVGATLLAPQFALAETGVPLRPQVGPEVLLRTGLRTALAYLRIAVDPDRIAPADLVDTLRRPARRLTGVVGADGRATSLAAVARRLTTVDAEHRAALRRYVDDVALLVGLVEERADSTRLLAAVRDTVGLGATLDALDRRRVRPEGSSHGDDLDALVELAVLEPDPHALPQRLSAHLEASARVREDGSARDGITHGVALSTVHRVKGREWDVVVVVGLHAGLVPHRLCDDTEEERRVLHVAITRARERLVLVGDPARPSPFLPELLGTLRPSSTVTSDEAALVAALRAWRRDRAEVDGVPAFLVAHDRTLADLAHRRPQDRRALRACHGMGPARVQRYGDELLALLRTGPTGPSGS